MFFRDRRNGLQEMFRVLVPGGRAAVYSWAPMPESPALSALMGALQEAFPETAPKQDENESIVRGLDNPEAFEQEMKEAGRGPLRKDIWGSLHSSLCQLTPEVSG